MILTVTPNSSVDYVLFIEEFQPGTTMRPRKLVRSVGGKALDASVVLQTLGVDNLALSFAAGAIGQQLVGLLDNYGIKHDLIWVDGETRIANVLVELKFHRHSHITTPGFAVSLEAYHTFFENCRANIPNADYVVAGGSLPGGVPTSFYRQLTELVHQRDVPILIDVAGLPLVEAVPAAPTIIKINQAEFTESFNIQAGSLETLITAAGDFRLQQRLPNLVLTCGSAGIVALTVAGTFQAVAPPQQAINAAGAGDSVSAVLAWRLSLGDSWLEALRWAAATAAAVVLTEGTADCRLVDIERILTQTEVRQL
jgi:1-phosphofructokinase family hexose kinase